MAAVEQTVRRRVRRLITVPVAVVATVGGMLVAATSAQALAPVHFVNSGTSPRPSTLGSYTLTAFPNDPDGLSDGSPVSSIPSPLGGAVGFTAGTEKVFGSDLGGGWNNGYTGSTYFVPAGSGQVETLTLPAYTGAFWFSARPGECGTYDITATTDNGTSSGPVSVNGDCGTAQPNGFGFYTTGAPITSITVSNNVGLDQSPFVGEFAIASTVTKDPKFTSADSATFTAGTAGSFTVSTKVDAAHGKASLSDGGCAWPNGVTFTDNGDGTGTLAGTPGANSGGVYTCTLTATNAHGSTTQSFTLTVNQAPHLTGPASDTFTVGSSGSYTYKATGYPGVPTISISSGTLPNGVSLAAPVHTTNAHGDNVTTVNLQGTPAAGSGGVYPVTLVASNGTLPDATLNVTITVYEAPHFTSAPHATFIANRYNQFQVTAAGGYPPGPLTFTTTGPLPAGVSLNSSGLLYGTPPVSASGYHHFTITVSNGHASATQDFVLFIHAPKVPAATLVAPDGLNVTALSATGECVTWDLSGFAPYAPVTVIAYPRLTTGVPYKLGTFTAGYNGRLTLNVCLPASARGAYDLLAAGYATNGSIHYQEAWTIVQP